MKKRSKNLSIIDNELEVTGTIVSTGSLVVRGCVRGNVKGEDIIIADEGSIYGDVEAATLTVGGIFEGEVLATESLVILSTGRFTGAATCRDLVMESGGLLNATVQSFTMDETPAVVEKRFFPRIKL
ncbi:MAG: bactofilin family protein [Thermodesulfobacteriota bacterium]